MNNLIQGTGNLNWEKKYIIDSCLSLGLYSFDTSEIYGRGVSEEVLGDRLYGKEAFIITKVANNNLSKEGIIKACIRSLRKLRRDFIDVYMVHWPNNKFDINETLSGLQDLKKRGLVKNIGLCNFRLNDIIKISDIIKLDFVQNEFNLIDRSALDLINFCSYNNIVFLGYSSFDQGHIFNSKYQLIAELSKNYNCSFSSIVLSWIRSKGVIPIVETYNKSHLKDNLCKVDINLRDLALLEDCFNYPIKLINPKLIRVLSLNRDDKKIYKTIEEAKSNKENFVPSPEVLAEELKLRRNMLKPIKVKHIEDNLFGLVTGSLRYWAWVIAFGDKPIEGIIVNE